MEKRHCAKCDKDFWCSGKCRISWILNDEKSCFCPSCFRKSHLYTGEEDTRVSTTIKFKDCLVSDTLLFIQKVELTPHNMVELVLPQVDNDSKLEVQSNGEVEVLLIGTGGTEATAIERWGGKWIGKTGLISNRLRLSAFGNPANVEVRIVRATETPDEPTRVEEEQRKVPLKEIEKLEEELLSDA